MTTHPFTGKTEALEVAQAFAGGICGKTVLVTGVNPQGIGFATAEAFASQSPAHLILAGRTPSKLEASIAALRAKYPEVDYRSLQLNLSTQREVRKAAAELLAWTDITAIDIIVNSAGIMNLPQRTMSDDGIEMQFATNHIGHFLFTCLLKPRLIQAASANPRGATRVVNVSSLSPTWAAMRWSDINFDKINKDLPPAEQPPYAVHRQWGEKDPENKSYLPLEGYNQSKVANVLFSIGANKRWYERHGILSITVHPGLIMTELARSASEETMAAVQELLKDPSISIKTLGGGAATSVVAALDPKLGPGETKEGKENWGVYLIDCQVSDLATPLAVSSDEAEKLWKLSEELVGEQFA